MPAGALAGGPRGRRLLGVDAVRGLALVGMVLTHLTPEVVDGRVTLAHEVAAGRSSAAFAVLAGTGLALATGGTSPLRGRARRAAAAGIAVRAAVVALLGALLGLLDPGIAIILVYYGVFFLLALPLLGLRARTAAAVAVLAGLATPVASHLLRPLLPAPDYANPTVGSLLADPVTSFWTITVTGYYPALTWTTYLAAGVAVGRLPLRRGAVAVGLVVTGALVAVTSLLASRAALSAGGRDALVAATEPGSRPRATVTTGSQLFGTTPTDSWWWLAVDAAHTGTPADLLGTAGTAVAAVGVGLLVARVAGRLLVPLAAVGATTLSWYCLHVAVFATGAGLGTPYLAWVVQVVVALGGAPLLLRHVRRGPLEAVVHAASEPVRAAVAEDGPEEGAGSGPSFYRT